MERTLLLAETGLPTLFFLMAMMITIGLLLMRTQRHFSRQSSAQPPLVHTPRPQQETPAHRFGAPPEMVAWEVSMHDTARDLSAQLDSKMAALEHLIREADRAAARLEAALDPDELQGVNAAPDRRPGEPPTANQVHSLRTSGSKPLPDTAPPDPPHTSKEARYQEIYMLSDYGYPPSEIARRVGSPVGEVELILSLRENR